MGNNSLIAEELVEGLTFKSLQGLNGRAEISFLQTISDENSNKRINIINIFQSLYTFDEPHFVLFSLEMSTGKALGPKQHMYQQSLGLRIWILQVMGG